MSGAVGPLDLKVDPINAGVLAKLRLLDGYDFLAITADAERKLGWSSTHSAEIEKQVKQFLSLAFLDPGFYHIPELDVDEYWHRMILHTQWYAKFCDDVFGSYYHHTPEPDPAHMNQANRDRSVKLADYWFGTKWANLVRTCTQCRGPFIVSGIAPDPQTMPVLP
ncbi:MAG: hypothetical protein WBQ75_11255 [Acetobacteraceae bacterium]